MAISFGVASASLVTVFFLRSRSVFGTYLNQILPKFFPASQPFKLVNECNGDLSPIVADQPMKQPAHTAHNAPPFSLIRSKQTSGFATFPRVPTT
jgi:hypothetical protein